MAFLVKMQSLSFYSMKQEEKIETSTRYLVSTNDCISRTRQARRVEPRSPSNHKVHLFESKTSSDKKEASNKS